MTASAQALKNDQQCLHVWEL